MNIPAEIENDLTSYFKKHGKTLAIQDFKPASGGCINNGGCLTTSAGDYFLKWNSSSRFPGMFRVEAAGLKALAETNVIRIPEVITYTEGRTYSWILMEYIETSDRRSSYWNDLGHQLAKLHKESSESYGLKYDNYIGSLPQQNTQLDNWVEFMITRRYEPMVEMALNSGKINDQVVHDFELLYGKLKGILIHEPPSLLHGDLWSGNVMTDERGSPVLIDPAVYYGNREIEVAFTTLFGGFDNEFYDAYQKEWPMESGFKERFDIYNLYPLMVHVNLFGGSYHSQVKQILRQYV